MTSSNLAKKRALAKVIGWILALAIACFCFALVRAQETRYTNTQYGISFMPPSGWAEDKTAGPGAVIQYVGPQRADGTRPALNMLVQNAALALNDEDVKTVVTGITEDFSNQRVKGAQVTDHRRLTVGGFNALQVDVSYNLGNELTRLRQVMVPVAEHKRTYILNLVDNAQHFGESAPVAEGVVNSFTAAVSRPPGGNTGTPGIKPPEESKTLLIITGVVALAVIIGSAYLLLRRRAAG